MRSLLDQTSRESIIRRLEGLSSSATPSWGRLTPGRLMCHLHDCLQMAHGERPTQPPRLAAFTHFPLKHLLLYLLPVPRNLQTAPELLATQPTGFDDDRRACVALIARFAQAPASGPGARHPFFGVLTQRQWGVLQYRHTDHHLRQFGV